ncbi:ribonuclease P protein subunit rpr2 [Pieris rapae]|uniref:ribonuclease P protein subunit rpr2 n=1 Tax=Pieris rapae TaxID=64459 RepID=UPI001E27E084|nr:ribonuclease P protein subunit rpr2 [Pieris rapae]
MKKVQGNDSFQRINYLYQISKQISAINPALSSYYGSLAINVAKKSVLKIHPDIKRQICKKCRCLLTNQTSIVKIKNLNKSKYVQRICKVCKTKKKFPADKNKEHKIWLEKEEAIVEVITQD